MTQGEEKKDEAVAPDTEGATLPTGSVKDSVGLASAHSAVDVEKQEQGAEDATESSVSGATVTEVLGTWAEYTSVHGVVYWLDPIHVKRWKRLIWALIWVAALVFMIWHITLLVQQYKEFNVNTNSESVAPPVLPFPQVTVCNTNKYQTSRQGLAGLLEPTNDEDINLLSQPLDEFIEETSFNSNEYETTDVDDAALPVAVADLWKPVVTPFGLCFQFNTDSKVAVPGLGGGLYFFAYLGQEDYTDGSKYAGLAIFVTEPGTQVTYQTAPVMTPPGAHSVISLQATEYNREKQKPWSRCNTEAPPSYRRRGCRAECEYRAIRNACGCRSLGDPDPNFPYCTSESRLNNTKCAQFWENYDQEEILLTCDTDCSLPPCNEADYSTSYSALAFSEVFKLNNAIEYNTTLDKLETDYVGVSINYGSIRVENVTESIAMTTITLFSNIGGTMGLYMGVSIISIIEVFGELMALRLVPRWWGDRRLYGIGSKSK